MRKMMRRDCPFSSFPWERGASAGAPAATGEVAPVPAALIPGASLPALPFSSPAGVRGIATSTTVPRPGSLVTPMLPPMRSTSAFVMDIPRPEPG